MVSGAASHTSVSLWSLQAGRLLGASASRQLLVQLPGVLLGAAVAIPTYYLLVSTHGLGSQALPVPTAQTFKAVAQLTAKGLAGMPPSSTLATGLAFLVGVLLSAGARGRLARLLPSAAAMGIGFVIPAFFAVTHRPGRAAGRWRGPPAPLRHADGAVGGRGRHRRRGRSWASSSRALLGSCVPFSAGVGPHAAGVRCALRRLR